MLELFQKIAIERKEVRGRLAAVLRARAQEDQQQERARRAQLTKLQKHKDQLLELRLGGEVDAEQFARKQREFREREDRLTEELEAAGRDQSELTEITSKTFELLQSLRYKWLVADYPEKCAILEIVASNFTLDDVTLVPEMRKPFDALAEGLNLVQSVP